MSISIRVGLMGSSMSYSDKIQNEYKKYLDQQIQFIIFVKQSPKLFSEIAHAIVDLVETLERIDDDLFSSQQREILKDVRAQFKTYLIKNS